jgi:hypothetical protein
MIKTGDAIFNHLNVCQAGSFPIIGRLKVAAVFSFAIGKGFKGWGMIPIVFDPRGGSLRNDYHAQRREQTSTLPDGRTGR